MPSSWLSIFNSAADDESDGVGDRISPPSSPNFSSLLRSAASFIAPPPPPSNPDDSAPPSSSQTIAGIKNDLVEIGGSFKSSLSLFSPTKAVSEFSNFASKLVQFDDDDDEEFENDVVEGGDLEVVVGVTDEVVDFAREISSRPECWTEFPLSVPEDFGMSDVQKDHAATIEELVPSLKTLRHKISSLVTDRQFWMIYFIMLLPRLSEDDSKILFTPEIVEAREILLHKLKIRNARVEVLEEPETSSSQEGRDLNKSQGMDIPSQAGELLAENVNAGLRIGSQDHKRPKSPPEAMQGGTEDDISFSDLGDATNDPLGRRSRIGEVTSQSEAKDEDHHNESLGHLIGQQNTSQSTYRDLSSDGEELSGWDTIDDVDLDGLIAA